jgi:hypothetical protein
MVTKNSSPKPRAPKLPKYSILVGEDAESQYWFAVLEREHPTIPGNFSEVGRVCTSAELLALIAGHFLLDHGADSLTAAVSVRVTIKAAVMDRP